MSEPISFAAVLKIIAIDIVLSGDNAVVIAMATRSLPDRLQRKAIFWGGAGAIGLRVVMTAIVAYLLAVPFVQLVGGLFLLWIAYKLLLGDGDGKEVKAGVNLRDAIVTIIAADFVMSLDNMLAVGGASHGSLGLLLAGLLLSMMVIMFFSGVIARLMNRISWLVYVGSGILSWTAAEMLLNDQWLHRFYVPDPRVARLIAGLMTASVLLLGYAASRRAAHGQEAAADDRDHR